MRAALALLAIFGACGDNDLPSGDRLSKGRELILVAHQDDDLLFMQPDLLDAVKRGGVTSVYVTAGNGRRGIEAAELRYEGLRAAYSQAAGDRDWRCGWIEIAGHTAEHCRLDAEQVSLVFLGYPDGGKLGERSDSLLHLWEAKIDRTTTIARRTASYTKAGMLDTITEIVRETQPQTIRTLEVSSTHGRDHSDHMIVGAIGLLAAAAAQSHAELVAYRGYNIADEPPNKIPAIYGATLEMLARYESCAAKCGTCGGVCTKSDPTHEIWAHRRYAVAFRANARGQLRQGTRCAQSDLSLGDCATAPSWSIDRDGQVHVGAVCLQASASGELGTSECTGGVSRRFFYDDEGHLWSGLPPRPTGTMDYAHLSCVDTIGGRLGTALCGADHAPAWELVPEVRSTSRAILGLTARGRAIRLGDLTGDGRADLCAIEPSGLLCATGDGTGAFAPAKRIDSASAPLAVDPRSLVIGDVDGDGEPDACGRDADGIACATAANKYAATRWTVAFRDAEARVTTSASLAAIDANGDGVAAICGVVAAGVICAPRGLAVAENVRSAWPTPAQNVWPGELDADHHADWCASTETGPACAVEAFHDLTTDGSPWGFARGGMVEVIPGNPDLTALGDIDGDGRADLCSIAQGHVSCARSQGRAFGPHTPLARLDGSALWLGDLDGDGAADACVDTGSQIACSLSR